jgi:SAM-dependent methyltransferase
MKECRVCKGNRLHKFLSLGDQPHCNHFLTAQELESPEPVYPLDCYYCDDCSLVQLAYVVPQEVMFRQYPYVSGTTITLRRHFSQLAQELVERFSLSSTSLVVDIGSNDGTFLKGFKRLGVRVLGVDPAINIAKMANEAGIETIPEFFGREVAAKISIQRGKARLVTAAGVFYHLPDLDDVVQGVYDVLVDDGVFVVQANYLEDMLEKNTFDNIYHEHLCYYSLKPLTVLFRRFDMEVFDVTQSSIHGGSIIVCVQKQGGPFQPTERVAALIAKEESQGIYSFRTYQRFAERVFQVRDQLTVLLRHLKSQGKRIAAYGAPAKGNTMLNFCEIGSDILDYASEKNILKVGFFTPGMHIPVISEEEAAKNPPDFYLVLPWNFLDEFLEKEKSYRARGGKFIVPVPHPHII